MAQETAESHARWNTIVSPGKKTLSNKTGDPGEKLLLEMFRPGNQQNCCGRKS